MAVLLSVCKIRQRKLDSKPCNAPAPYLRPYSVSWCLTPDYWNKSPMPRWPKGPMWLGKRLHLLHSWYPIKLIPHLSSRSDQSATLEMLNNRDWYYIAFNIRTPELSLSTFKCRLKTQLFQHPWSIVRRRCDWSASLAPYTNIQTQLNSVSECNIHT